MPELYVEDARFDVGSPLWLRRRRLGTASEGSNNPAAMQKVCRQFERELLQASWFRWKGTAGKRPEFRAIALLRS